MKALIYYGPKDIRMEERPMPVAGERDAVVKVVRAGICGSDLTAYLHDGLSVGILKNGQFGHDGQFGHEMVGIVHALGEKVTGIQVGDRVFINPTTCKRTGMLGCDIAGAFSEYMLVEDAQDGNNLFPLAQDTSFDDAVVIEPLAVGTHGKNCVDVKPHERVVVYGAGTIGLCTLNALLAVGCHAPVVVDVKEERLELVRKMGGIPFHSAQNGDVKEFLLQHFGATTNLFGQSYADVDVFIDCAGAAAILPEIVSNAKNSARISIVAVHKQKAKVDAAVVLSNELMIKGSCGYQREDILEAFNNVNYHRIGVGDIVTHHFPHERIQEAFEFAADPASGGVKVVIDYN